MLSKSNDGHVRLTAPGKDVFYVNKIRRELIDKELFNISVIKDCIEPGVKEGQEYSYMYGKIKDENVAYIYFDHVAENFFKLNDFLNEYDSVNVCPFVILAHYRCHNIEHKIHDSSFKLRLLLLSFPGLNI